MKKTDKTRTPGGPANERFTEGAILVMRGEIGFCGGDEGFFAGKVNDDGLVTDVEPLARGNDQAVPVLMESVSPADVIIHNHPTGFLVPSEADIAVASRLGNDGVGCYIVDNGVTRVYAVVEPGTTRAPCEALDPDEIAGLLGEGGPLASVHPQYEVRPTQCRMAAQVARVLDSGSVGVFEAGTGTGKSLAFLIPALKWALAGDRRVVVATNTINLQEQHLKQDLPLVGKVIREPINAVLVKGRGNYLCLRKRNLLDTDTGEVLLDFDDMKEMQSLLEWSRNTSEGSLSDLSFVPADANWNLIRSESDSCLRARCSHFSSCFYYQMRRRAASAQVLFANHHVLFADLSFRSSGQDSSSIMPKYDAVILDEAHNVEDVALSYFDSSFGRWGVTSTIGRLVSRRKQEKGLIPFLLKKVHSSKSLSSGRKEKLTKRATEVFDCVQERRVRLESAFENLAGLFTVWLGTGNSSQDRWRITEELRREKQWEDACELLGEIWDDLSGVLIPLRKLNRYLKDIMEDGHEDLAGHWTDTGAVVGRLESSLDFITRAISGCEEDEVFWAQVRSGRRPSVTLHLTPIDAAGLMESNLFSTIGPVVLTSATLTVGGTFRVFEEKTGYRSAGSRQGHGGSICLAFRFWKSDEDRPSGRCAGPGKRRLHSWPCQRRKADDSSVGGELAGTFHLLQNSGHCLRNMRRGA